MRESSTGVIRLARKMLSYDLIRVSLSILTLAVFPGCNACDEVNEEVLPLLFMWPALALRPTAASNISFAISNSTKDTRGIRHGQMEVGGLRVKATSVASSGDPPAILPATWTFEMFTGFSQRAPSLFIPDDYFLAKYLKATFWLARTKP